VGRLRFHPKAMRAAMRRVRFRRRSHRAGAARDGMTARHCNGMLGSARPELRPGGEAAFAPRGTPDRDRPRGGTAREAQRVAPQHAQHAHAPEPGAAVHHMLLEDQLPAVPLRP
jgi:hypothetical protein